MVCKKAKCVRVCMMSPKVCNDGVHERPWDMCVQVMVRIKEVAAARDDIRRCVCLSILEIIRSVRNATCNGHGW